MIRLAVFCSILSLLAASARGQEPRALAPATSQVQQLYESSKFNEVLALLPPPDHYSAALELYRGLALARLGRWNEARAAFSAGRMQSPRDARFSEELAGAEYELKDFRAAKADLHRALALSPGDEYAHDFLGTIYFLEGNLDAALDHWNRIGKPEISTIQAQPEPRLRNTLLERSFAIAPLSVMKLDGLRATRARLDNLGVFTTYSFTLIPASVSGSSPAAGSAHSPSTRSTNTAKDANSDPAQASTDAPQTFTVDFHSMERNGWGSGTVADLLSIFRGLPYLTVHPEYFNFGQAARNFVSLYRWDDNKRRIFFSFSEPLGLDPKWKLTLAADARNENWNLSQTFHPPAPGSGLVANADAGVNVETVEFAPELRRVQSGRWSWETGPVFSYRRFRNPGGSLAGAQPFFTSGDAMEYGARSDYRILDLPERRLTLDSFVKGSFGKNFARELGSFASLRGGLHLRWFPRARGNDYETNFQLRSGKWFGSASLDQLYQLGIERDNGLWLHGIAGTRGGRKGSAPLGREYFLANWETDKQIYDNGLIDVSIGPLFDAGRVADPSGLFGSSGWRWDPGAALKLRFLGIVGIQLSYARDIPTGAHALYASPVP